MKSLADRIFDINSEAEFTKLVLEVQQLQVEKNPVYKKYCGLLKKSTSTITEISYIPFLPVELFKSHEILTDAEIDTDAGETVFTSSGTTGQITSRHIVKDLSLYEKSFLKAFEIFYGKPSEFCFLFLLPSYLERSGSSLVYMAEKLIKLSEKNGSGFFLHNLDELKEKLIERKKANQKTFLFGVSYALLDLAEKNIPLNENFIVMETGGMKGKRKEMVKEEFHGILKEKFSVNKIHSEYGMTELLSQAYSVGEGIFKCPPWMKILVRDAYEPSRILEPGKTGCINVIDLANINSSSFIATQDLGKVYEDGSFEILGRMDNSEIRGCNLMVE